MSPRRIYILPTQSCIPLMAVLLAMAYAALSQHNSGAYLLGFFLAGLAVVSMTHTHFALTRLRLRAGRIEPAFAGQPARVPVEVENPTWRSRSALSVAAGAGAEFWPWRRRPSPTVPSPCFVAQLEGRRRVTVEIAIPTRKRGRFAVERLAASTVYPLGFFFGWFYEETDATYFVYPAPANRRPLPTAPLALGPEVALGVATAGDDYMGVRPYVPGESQRHIDWRAVARGQPLFVKQFAGMATEHEPIWLNWSDLNEFGENVEARLSHLCRWVLDADAAGLWYGLRLPSGEIPLATGDAHRQVCLRALAVFGMEGD